LKVKEQTAKIIVIMPLPVMLRQGHG